MIFVFVTIIGLILCCVGIHITVISLEKIEKISEIYFAIGMILICVGAIMVLYFGIENRIPPNTISVF